MKICEFRKGVLNGSISTNRSNAARKAKVEKLMAEIAAIALREGLVALRWEVLDWNRPAIDFYKRLGTTFLDDWKAVRLEGEGLRRLAGITQ